MLPLGKATQSHNNQNFFERTFRTAIRLFVQALLFGQSHERVNNVGFRAARKWYQQQVHSSIAAFLREGIKERFSAWLSGRISR